VIEWLRDGLEGRSLKTTLRLYLFGLMVLALPAALIGYLFDAQTSFQTTPLLVLILVGVEYALCYRDRILRVVVARRPNASLSSSTTFPEEGCTPKVKVIGIGGAGGNAINTMIQAHVAGVEFIAANSDLQTLDTTLTPLRLQLGVHLTKGLGAGANPDIGRKAAQEDWEAIAQALEGADMVFITAGMGGGTGTGASPVVARIAREAEILTVAVVTKPFTFEGRARMAQAEAGLLALREHVHALIVIPNQRLLEMVDKGTTLRDTFKVADAILRQAVQSIADLITTPGLIHVDFSDVQGFMSEMGVGFLGIGVARGERRAVEAARQALACPLLGEASMAETRGVLINVTGAPDLSLAEVQEVVMTVHQAVHEGVPTIFGSIVDESMEDEVRVTIIVTCDRTKDQAEPSQTRQRMASLT
jgi:cell division protein FtsZ